MFPVNEGSFTSSFLVRYPDLVSDSREKRLGCKCDASCRLLVDALYQVEEVLFYF